MSSKSIPKNFELIKRSRKRIVVRTDYKEKLLKEKIFEIDRLISEYKEDTSVKDHGRGGVMTISLGEENLYVRQYLHGGLFGKIIHKLYLYPIRPLCEISLCEKAREKGVKTTETIAGVFIKYFLIFHEGYIVTKAIENSKNLFEYLSDFRGDSSKKKKIIKKVAKAISVMHNEGFFHYDLQLKNILVQEKDDETLIFIIDFDRSRMIKKLSKRKRLKNVMRLDRSVRKLFPERKEIKPKDRLRFLKEYQKWAKNFDIGYRRYIKKFKRHLLFHKIFW